LTQSQASTISVILKPRFALLGDWNCTWFLAHNVPTEDILRQHVNGATFRFEFPLAHLLTEIPSDNYEVKVALPEGAQIISFDSGRAQARAVTTTKSFSYLDFIGRPTLVFSYDNYLPRVDLKTKIQIEYTFQPMLVIIEPLYLVVGLFLCFLAYIVFSRTDLSFGSEEYAEQLELAQAKKPAVATQNAPVKDAKKK
jgi:oligosaccharyltransferase complex subunit alpha (ribophorin I)